MVDVLDAAARVFESYAAQGLPGDSLASMQAQLAAWQGRHFGASSIEQIALGVAEEAGELAHATMKHAQQIGLMKDETIFRAAAADALGDIAVFCMQYATALRLDYETIVQEVAGQVLLRNPHTRGTE